jgi:hypothetical protein
VPPSVEVANSTCSLLRPLRPSAQALTILLVASAPVGAPLAMSTLGSGPRSSRAPPMPSSTQRPIDGSKALQRSVAAMTGSSYADRAQMRSKLKEAPHAGNRQRPSLYQRQLPDDLPRRGSGDGARYASHQA